MSERTLTEAERQALLLFLYSDLARRESRGQPDPHREAAERQEGSLTAIIEQLRAMANQHGRISDSVRNLESW